jgi:hypothetical protein
VKQIVIGISSELPHALKPMGIDCNVRMGSASFDASTVFTGVTKRIDDYV